MIRNGAKGKHELIIARYPKLVTISR